MAEILIAIRARVGSLFVIERREQLGVFSHRSNKINCSNIRGRMELKDNYHRQGGAEKWTLPFETQTAITHDVKRK
jgi:hypothetical protein